MDDKNWRGLQAENEAADELASKGYNVEQDPPRPPGSNKNPDYKIEGHYFDCVAPNNTGGVAVGKKARNVRSRIYHKVVTDKQADRIVVNMNDVKDMSFDELRQALVREPVDGLKEVIAVKGDQVVHVFP